ncbi:hypothetical protein B296_00028113 [Ensete ventricosum]|uniref:Uncharacterized protein n=1 Tax=Ensete ventricosum TaxID=4639 RepID=A0A426YRF5_ENSVE|nr:hypothetical protein B296_00028113 [Ensete ventricosum]
MMSKVFCPPNAIFLVDGRTVHLPFPGVFVLPEIDELMYILHPSSSLLRERADLLRRRWQWRNGIPTAAATAWRRGACGFPAAGLVEEAEIGGALQLHKAQYPSHARIPLADPFSPCHATVSMFMHGLYGIESEFTQKKLSLVPQDAFVLLFSKLQVWKSMCEQTVPVSASEENEANRGTNLDQMELFFPFA